MAVKPAHKFPAGMMGITGAEPMFFSASLAKAPCPEECWLGDSFAGGILNLVFDHCWFWLLTKKMFLHPDLDHTPLKTICTAIFYHGSELDYISPSV